jgi:ABC-type polysaccharide/polyol phosphate transport system ATPase subunit
MRLNTSKHGDLVIDADSVSKAFNIPTDRRTTIREYAFSLWRPRRFERLEVLDRVSLQLHRGETLGIMGRNGCGKSTLLKILCGIYQPDRGRISIRARITPILELGIGWNPELNAIDNVLLIGSVLGVSLKHLHATMPDILAFAELERFSHLELKHFSSGMSARLAYAVAFHAVREILIIDEVFAVGDAGFRERCENRYRELRARGHSVILVSHNPQIISTFCDRALLLEQGRVAAHGSARDVVDQYLAMLTHSDNAFAAPA